MSRYKWQERKKWSLLISLILVITLGLTGISYGSWNDTLSMDVAVDTAEFDPQIEVYKIVRIRDYSYLPDEVFYPCIPLRPDANGVIKVSVGRRTEDPIPWWYPALLNDEYKIYYRVINNSTIPVGYKAVSQNLTPEQENYVSALPTDWSLVGANSSDEGNYVSLFVKYEPMTIKMGKVIKQAYDPFNVGPTWTGDIFDFFRHLDKTFARVQVKQFNTIPRDSGWSKDIEIRLLTNDFIL